MNLSKLLPAARSPDCPPNPTTRLSGRPDVGGITETIRRALAAAGLNTQTGPMKDVTDTIHNALSAAGLTQAPSAPIARNGATFDGQCHEVDARYDAPATPGEGAAPATSAVPGAFLDRSFTNDAGTRRYRLYVPSRNAANAGDPVAAIVMLHGCTQSPEDFAAGTRMNALADQHGFLVIYPAQDARANGSRCWNWFRPEDQLRDSGEPALIAGITREVASAYRVDPQRIFVAGMSAGASMAVILGALYPELYRAIGVHSGLPYGAAHDMPSAFSAMQGGSGRSRSPAGTWRAIGEGSPRVPAIVFHGDHDRTVNARNADTIVTDFTDTGAGQRPLRADVRHGIAPGGRRYRCTEYVDDAARTVVEHWVVQGAGHAWSGGSSDGSFTDPRGPDASVEMVRFFFAQPQAVNA